MLDAVTLDNRALTTVSDLKVVAVSSSTLGVSWAPVTNVTKYLVQWSTTPDFDSSEVCIITHCTLTVPLTAYSKIAQHSNIA
jgi:hypothetical protein